MCIKRMGASIFSPTEAIFPLKLNFYFVVVVVVWMYGCSEFCVSSLLLFKYKISVGSPPLLFFFAEWPPALLN